VDPEKGASITWLSSGEGGANVVNIHDPGRLIQQSYYAGELLDRTAEGQSKSWSPWAWNPIQGGGVRSWARASVCHVTDEGALYSETIPKLWDMPDEPARALMRQWTRIPEGMPDTVEIHNLFISRRPADDAWGPAKERHQEMPALYFVRSFHHVKTYLGDGQWQAEEYEPGPPWFRAQPPRRAMACFDDGGRGIAVFSPVGDVHWNYGGTGTELTDNPEGNPTMHMAPITSIRLAPDDAFSYTYWIVCGDEASIAERLEQLWQEHQNDTVEYGTADEPPVPPLSCRPAS
jgi:hypothetical protein